uniref:Choline/Carnitine Oacyltransferase putative n=1 Tax=Albugo laibachii Nc14 TaxID=890382 RepID=F0WZJ7_9STRA|nr:choline/Carnitine Oacyltransferase putative [Albugo laibachii Nc14]|eukprot:CCA26921.1 choline/Carnitine Oacyltransferase putative [Albugo laibachii Nc14]
MKILDGQRNTYGPLHYRECQGDYRCELDLEDRSLDLYKHQSSIPSLPVPSIDETLDLYLQSVAPLCKDEKEFREAADLLIQFKKSPICCILQNRLIQRAQEFSTSSYLAAWWNTEVYLQDRSPLAFNVSYFFHFSDSIHPEQSTQAGRAAALLRASMIFRQGIVSGQSSTDFVGRGANRKPMCATAYKYMFNSCRIPCRGQDYYKLYDPSIYRHVVVMHRNHFYTFSLFHESNSNGQEGCCTLLTFEEIKTQIEMILDDTSGEASPIGLLTAQNRDTWARQRAILLSDGNKEALEAIESGVLLLSLEEDAPASRQEIARALWHGNGRNRFLDKCIQLFVFRNAKAGLLGEHAMLDGMPMSVYADFIITRLHRSQIDLGRGAVRDLPKPQKLQFYFSPSVLSSIYFAGKLYQHLIHAHTVNVTLFHGFGKHKIIKEYSCSPDAFVQVAIQVAYRRLFGKSTATYEAIQTRSFLHGRTETARSCSRQSAEFARSMAEENSTSSPAKKKSLLLDAVKGHVNYMHRAAQGRGVDRHLLALRHLIDTEKDGAVPFFEQNPLLKRSSTWQISTSHLSHELFDGWGWGPVVPDGFGIAYSVKKNCIQFNIACLRDLGQNLPEFDPLECDWAQRMGDSFDSSLIDMSHLFEDSDSNAATMTPKL